MKFECVRRARFTSLRFELTRESFDCQEFVSDPFPATIAIFDAVKVLTACPAKGHIMFALVSFFRAFSAVPGTLVAIADIVEFSQLV